MSAPGPVVRLKGADSKNGASSTEKGAKFQQLYHSPTTSGATTTDGEGNADDIAIDGQTVLRAAHLIKLDRELEVRTH